MVGGADVGFRPTPGRQLNANRSSLVRTLPGSSGTGRGSKKSGPGNVGLVTHRLAQAHRRRRRILASFRGRRGHGSIRLLDGWGFRASNRQY